MLEVHGLTKRFRAKIVVDGVSFSIASGQILGYLGPNGAGKSTTVKMLAGLLPPTSGQILYCGRDVHSCLTEYKAALGYVPEEPLLYPYLTGWEYLLLVGRLRAMPESKLEQRSKDLLQLFNLYTARHTVISAYSKGMRQKILIIASLLHNPKILLFDEPLSGLDVTTSLVFRHLVDELATCGKIVLYSSHVLEVVEKLCSRVLILHQGKIVANDSVAALRQLMQLPSLEEIFTQLAIREEPLHTARNIAAAVLS